MVYRYDASFPSWKGGFDSRYLLLMATGIAYLKHSCGFSHITGFLFIHFFLYASLTLEKLNAAVIIIKTKHAAANINIS